MSAEDDLSRRLGPVRKAALASEILLLYVRARWQLRRQGLAEVLEDLRAAAEKRPPRAQPAVSYRLAWAVERVLGRLPADSRCLVRSLVLVGLLARRSVPATLVIGVRPGSRFAAHAWVEHDGGALLPDGQGRFKRLAEL